MMMYHEESGDVVQTHYPFTDVVFRKETAVGQTVECLDSEDFGRMLFIDGEAQSAETDEFIYHEALVHPAMSLKPNASQVLIIGGGEGATLREVLKYPGVQEAVMVDFDEELVELCAEHMPMWSQGAFESPRARMVFADALEYMRRPEARNRFDVVLVDLPDAFCFTEEFLRLVRGVCRDEGTVVAFQGGPFSILHRDSLRRTKELLEGTFGAGHVNAYKTFVPFFQHEWCFWINRCGANLGRLQVPVRSLDDECMKQMFRLPPYLRGDRGQ